MSHPIYILVTGANGQVGMECRQLAPAFPQAHFIFTGSAELSITDTDAVEALFSSYSFSYCINAAAYTAVDAAESDEAAAFAVNADAVALLARVCRRHNCRLIHFSTDYVFEGENPDGYAESDATSPINVYGRSKREGEIRALQEQPSTLIIRTSWVYSVYGKNFVKTMLRLMREKPVIRVVQDQIGRPTYAADLAAAVFSIIFHAERFEPGLFHYANRGSVSWHAFALAIRDLAGLTCDVEPIASAEYPVPARRPHYSILRTEKIESTYGLDIPYWSDSLSRCLSSLM